MSDEKKNMGAPSSDETSALFVSARKKQLAQQEEERKRQEEEQKRLAAEAEVRRMEEEVQARKKAAEEEAKRIEEERQRVAQEQAAAKAADAVNNVGSAVGSAVGGAFGNIAKAAKTAAAKTAETVQAKADKPKAEKPVGDTGGASSSGGASGSGGTSSGGASGAKGITVGGKKLDVKTLAIIGGAAVVVIVLLVVLLGGGGGGGGSKSGAVFTTSMNDFAALSADDQSAYVESAMAYLEAQGYEYALPEDTREAAITTCVKMLKEDERIIEEAGLGQAVLAAQGIPLTLVANDCYHIAASEVHELLHENINYREFTAEEIKEMNLFDFVRLEGDDYIAALLTAEDWLVANEAMYPEHNILMLDAALTMQNTVIYVTNQAGPNATNPMGLLAAYGHLMGGNPAAVQELTGYDMGVFISVPETSDSLDTEFTITAVGLKLYYPGSSFAVGSSDRNYLRIYPISNAETASLGMYFSGTTVTSHEDLSTPLYDYADEVLTQVYGNNVEFASLEAEIKDEGSTVLVVNGYFFDGQGQRVDIYLRAAVLTKNNAPYVTLIEAPPARISTYVTIAENMRGTFEWV